MASLNRAELIGNLGKDPVMRQTQNGKNVASFSIATSEQWTDAQGQKQERTEWHNIVCFAALADVAQKFLAKGKQVYVDGRIQSRKYQDKAGVERSITEIVAAKIVLLGKREQTGSNADANTAGNSDAYESDASVPF